MCSVPRIVSLLVATIAIVAFNLFLYTRDASGHLTDNSYAWIREWSEAPYRGVVASVDFQNPALGTGAFTNSTLWVENYQWCMSVSGGSWVEGGWSKRASWPGHPTWAGQARHKFMYVVPTNCTFSIWPFDIGKPVVGPFYEYRLVYSLSNNRWEYVINGAIKAAVKTSWPAATDLQVGSELAPSRDGTVYMGPTHFEQLRYLDLYFNEASFYYYDSKHCDANPPLFPYNLIFPVSAPDWIYVWGPAAGGYCGAGAP